MRFAISVDHRFSMNEDDLEKGLTENDLLSAMEDHYETLIRDDLAPEERDVSLTVIARIL